ncbi:MAG: hypothetical protein J6U01_12670 [Clostridia bacterium]|nr:hypothetical protein [Clostridia bacterium]
MKKFLCAVLMICLLMSAAMAETATTELSWETFVPVLEAAELGGQFHTFSEVSAKMWLPEGMNPVELTEENKANGYIACFAPDDNSTQVTVVYTNVNGMSAEEYAAAVSKIEGTTEIEVVTVNGLPCVTYKMPEKDVVCGAFVTEAGYVLEITCFPASFEHADVLWGAVVCSVQPAE